MLSRAHEGFSFGTDDTTLPLQRKSTFLCKALNTNKTSPKSGWNLLSERRGGTVFGWLFWGGGKRGGG